jgi:hypothetical protein
MSMLEFDLEHTLFEAGFFLLFISMITMIVSIGFLRVETWKIGWKLRTSYYDFAVAFYFVTCVSSVVFREFLSKNVITEYLVFSLGVTAIMLAIQTVPFVLLQWHYALNSIFYRKQLDKLKGNAK